MGVVSRQLFDPIDEGVQAELGVRVGVSRQAIIAIETGRFDPSLPLAFKLARLFKVSLEDAFEPDGK